MKCRNCKHLGKLVDENGEPYDWCEEVIDCPDTQMERDCKHFVQATNADRIRSMTDEELAVILAKITEPNKLPMFHGLFMNGEKDVWLDWLRQEAQYG